MDESIAPVASPTAPPSPTTPVNPNQNFLSSDSFLKILAAELQYQDPLEPQSNSEFVSQMASFSGLDYQERIVDGIEALSLSSSLTQGAALIGTTVTFSGTDGATSGTVERLTVSDGAVTLVVDGREVPLGDVTAVGP